MGFLIYRGGERKKYVSRGKIDECIAALNKKLKHPRGRYHIDQSFIDRLSADLYDEKLLTEVALNIIRHCGLKPTYLRVMVVDTNAAVAGTYSNYYGQSVITIVRGEYRSPNDVVATLVHECMHFYLNAIGLRYEDRNMNEYLTDVATVYMGFYDIVEKGYFRQGYLTTNDLKRVQKKIKNQVSDNVVAFRR
ncbi:MAG: hypothetical protein IKQ83_06495 [Lachnospiraceae bacterium]|nr:hypothetical protein [Lachnospiraceae bacterium]